MDSSASNMHDTAQAPAAQPASTASASSCSPKQPSSQQQILDSDFGYVDHKGNIMKSRTELTVSQMLDFLDIKYEYNHKIEIGDYNARVDFKTEKGLIEVIDGDEDIARYKKIKSALAAASPGQRIMAVGNAKYVASIGEMDDITYYDKAPQTGSIFLEDPSFSFDYAHILPLVTKCSILHGHTSSVMVELVGQMKDNLLVDFGIAKGIIKEVVAIFDHKFFINDRYMAGHDDSHYTIKFDGPKGRFDLQVPKDTTYLLKGEATVENLATEIIRLLAPKMPPNVEAIGVYIYEGYNKGSHIITKIRDISK